MYLLIKILPFIGHCMSHQSEELGFFDWWGTDIGFGEKWVIIKPNFTLIDVEHAPTLDNQI